MSEVKRPANTGSEMSDWAARANAYMDHLQSLIDAQVEKLKGRRLALDELEAERDGWKRIADEMQGDYGEMEAERDLLRDNLKRIRDAVWETGVCGVLAKLEETE